VLALTITSGTSSAEKNESRCIGWTIKYPSASRWSVVLVAISAVTAEAAAVTATTVAALVSATVECTVVPTVVVPSAAAIVGEVAGPDEPVHREGDSGYRSIPLLPRLRFAKNAPNEKDATRDEPQKGGLSDLLRSLEELAPPNQPSRDEVREQNRRTQRAECRTQQPHENDHDMRPSFREGRARREAALKR
jgi:hypothetical protein